MNYWLITKDHTFDAAKDKPNMNREGCERHYTYKESKESFKARPDVVCHKWRTLDDDNNLYHEGLIWVTQRADGGECLFNPLDEFSQPDAGATTIEYFNETTKEWQVL